MADPLGILGSLNRAGLPGVTPAARISPNSLGAGEQSTPGSVNFREELARQIGEVNKLQEDATVAAEDVLTGRRSDMEGVMLATQKADSAFRMLLAVRNKVMDAYDEVKQMRV